MVPSVMDGHDVPALYGPAIGTLPLMFAIVDASGMILSTNETWSEFGRANGTEVTPNTLGVNYLGVADMADDTTGQQAAEGTGRPRRRAIRRRRPNRRRSRTSCALVRRCLSSCF